MRYRATVRAIVVLFLALVVTACGGSGISADDCDDIVEETLELFQRLIDDIDAEFGDMSVEQFVMAEGDLPSLDAFAADARTIDDLAAGLGCTQAQISSAVDARVGDLSADTALGRFIIDAIRTGGL